MGATPTGFSPVFGFLYPLSMNFYNKMFVCLVTIFSGVGNSTSRDCPLQVWERAVGVSPN